MMRRRILRLLLGSYLLICFAALALADPDKTRMSLEAHDNPNGGTVTGIFGQQSWSPVVAYDPENNRYLVVYEHVTEDFDYQIFGRIVTLDGVPLGSPFVISAASTAQHEPCIARGFDGKFLVVWEDDRSIHTEIYGQFINSNGTLDGSEQLLSTGDGNKYNPWVAHSSAQDRFLVVWEDYRNMSVDIYGQLVDEKGSLYGTNVAIANSDGSQYDPAVAYDTTHDRFLVAWADDRNVLDTGFDLFGQFVNADWGDSIDPAKALYLTSSDVNFVISNATQGQTRPSVVFEGATYNRFLVVWMDDRHGTTHDIYGQFVNVAGGELIYDPPDLTQNIPLSLAEGNQSAPFVVKDDCKGGFWVAWADDRNSGQEDLYGQLLHEDGTSDEPDFVISNFKVGEHTPAMAAHGNCGALVAFESQQSSGSVIGFVAIEGQAKISVSPSSVNFGNVAIGNSGEQVITISNAGHAALTVTAFEVLGPDADLFDVTSGGPTPCSDFPTVLTPGSACTLLTAFTPAAVGTKTSILRISSDDPGTPGADVSLRGNGFVYTRVTVVSPNGRESFVTGENTLIKWGAPDTAVNFKLFYSVNNGVTWVTITKDFTTGTSYEWTVPSLTANKKACLVRVVGYEEDNVLVGSDLSDAPFSIEVVKLTYPDGGETFSSGGAETLTWSVNMTKRPVASIKLYYTKNNGLTWTLITTLAGDETGYEWTPVPTVTAPKTKCKVKVVLKDAHGVTLGSDTSDGYFTLTNER